jgi:hypothetical protein
LDSVSYSLNFPAICVAADLGVAEFTEITTGFGENGLTSRI